ncbi:MAG TPA: ATP-binding cassette domain-containing protein [Jatrophihabitans sp.]|nr:ATP-binding cassette domain-containing protein [Jatrophihabitans sp.]
MRAVDQLSFSVEPGTVTGFLGPNGAGKTTTLRILLGLVHPTGGWATIGGRPYRQLEAPARAVGASLESSSFHPGRTARNHLRIMCTVAGLPDQRADAVLELVGLRDDARRKVRGYSLGMRQRLGLAQALLGDPAVLILDEPANGLDPDGIRWLRGFLRMLADQGRTVLISSHQLAEIEAVANHVVILNRGRLVRSGSLAELTAGTDRVLVRSPAAGALGEALARAGAQVVGAGGGTLQVRGMTTDQVGHLAFQAGIELHELAGRRSDLEELFFALTAAGPPPATPPPGYQAPEVAR